MLTPRTTGSTLLETLVVTTILGMVIATTFQLFAGGARVFSRETTDVRLQSDNAGALNVLLDDLSVAGYRPNEAGDPSLQALPNFPSVTTGTPLDRVTFLADIDSDGATEQITYEVSAGSLTRQVEVRSGGSWTAGPADVVASGVQSFELSFLDGNRTQISSGFSAARFVRGTLVLSAPARGGTVSKTLFGETAVRNG